MRGSFSCAVKEGVQNKRTLISPAVKYSRSRYVSAGFFLHLNTSGKFLNVWRLAHACEKLGKRNVNVTERYEHEKV